MSEQIVAKRTVQPDATHDHVELVGYRSVHIVYEPIMLSVERTLQRMALGERFSIKEGGQEIDLVEGKCSVCGHEPYLRTKADAEDEEKLMALPEA